LAWFGGVSASESGSIEQTSIIPAGGVPTLKYWLRISGVAAPFDATFVVKVDGVVVQTITEPQTPEVAYAERTIVLPTSVANGNAHTFRFEYTNPAGSGSSSFLVDDITLETRTGCAGPVAVSGRVLTPAGLGIRNATVVITDSLGVRRGIATTSSFGNYSFTNVVAGESYIIGVLSKRYRFAPQSLLISTTLTNVDFVGLE